MKTVLPGKTYSAAAFLAFLCLLHLQGWCQEKEKQVVEQLGWQITQSSSALDSIKNELLKGRRKLADLERREESALGQLEQLQENILIAGRYLNALEKQIESMDGEIAGLETRLQHEQILLRQRQEKMKQRLRAMSMSGDIGYFHILFSSKNLTDMLYKVRYFQELKRYDTHLLRMIDSSKTLVEQNKTALEQEREKQRALRNEKRKEQTVLVEDKNKQQRMTGEIQAEKTAYQAAVTALEQAQQELLSLLKQLEKRKVRAETEYERSLSITFEGRKGKLPWPVSGKIVRGFGKIVHPVYQTVTMSNGIDIQTVPGEKVICVAPGTVIHIGQMRGLGTFIIVDHYGGYVTIYANLRNLMVEQEQELVYGSVIGEVAAAGVSGESQFHFEIRKSTQSLDPGVWLEKQEI